jgi:hypothetical protein
MISRFIDRWFDDLSWESYIDVLATLPETF